jgi:AsmA family protein
LSSTGNAFFALRTLRGWQRALLGALVVLILAAIAVVVTQRHLKGVLERALAARSGRVIHIQGQLRTQLLSLHPSLSADRVAIENPGWLPPGLSAEIGRVELLLAWHLALPALSIERLELQHADLHLLRDAHGRANWQLREDGPGSGPPLIRSLAMPAARVQLHDARLHLEFNGTVSAGDVSTRAPHPALRIAGSGTLNGRAATFVVDGQPLAEARPGSPYHFSLKAHSGTTHLSGRGALEEPFDFRALQGTFEALGPSMKDLYFLVGLKLPDTAPFRLSGRLACRGERFTYSDLAATAGESDLTGSLTLDSSGKRPQLRGELRAERLRVSDLGARAAGRAPAEGESDSLLPDTPFSVAGLKGTDSHIRAQAGTLIVGRASLHDVDLTLTIEHGVLSIDPVRAKLAGGSADGHARFDASKKTPQGTLDLTWRDLHLEDLSANPGVDSGWSGLLSGRAQLTGQGDSAHAMAANAQGTLIAVIPHGAMRTAIAAGASLDVSAALGALSKSGKETTIRCGVANFAVQDGVLTARTLLLDTDQALITGRGEVHLDTQQLNLTLRGKPKHAGLGLRAPVNLRGSVKHPTVSIEKGALLAQSGAAIALGVLLSPLASVLAFVSPGLSHGADCEPVVSQAQARTE